MSEPDQLADLRDQIRAATDAAERLVRDARAGRDQEPRPTGWRPPPAQTPAAGWHQAQEAGPQAELAALVSILTSLWQILPAELRLEVADLTRQLLMVLRALIDWAVTCLEREGQSREVEAEVEDIPIA